MELPGGSSNSKTSSTGGAAPHRASKRRRIAHRARRMRGAPRAEAATARPRRPEERHPTERANAGASCTGHDARAELPGQKQQRQDPADRRSGAPLSEQTQAHRAQRARRTRGAPRMGAATARPCRPEERRPTERANAGASRTVGSMHARSSQGGSSNGKTPPTGGAAPHQASKRRRIAHSGHDAHAELPGWEQQRQDPADRRSGAPPSEQTQAHRAQRARRPRRAHRAQQRQHLTDRRSGAPPKLLALEDLAYVGPAPFLDALLATFSAAPHLRDLHLTLFNQPTTLSILHIAEFVHAYSANNGPPHLRPVPTLAPTEFSESSTLLMLTPPAPTPSASAPTPTLTSSGIGSTSNTQHTVSLQEHSAGDTHMKQKVLVLEEAIKQVIECREDIEAK
ncbi:hypothetical protein BC826DRAFT_1109294 [Russula brevipes]|nr:hypothetical protein BC826DRAFT_1109294 [Russula brevipes]